MTEEDQFDDQNGFFTSNNYLDSQNSNFPSAASTSHLPEGSNSHYANPTVRIKRSQKSLDNFDLSMDDEGNSSSGNDFNNYSLPSLPVEFPAKALKRSKVTKAKGKGRAKKVKDDEDDDGESDFEGKKVVKPKPRKQQGEKKKTSRACGACQKAHLTCDDCEYN